MASKGEFVMKKIVVGLLAGILGATGAWAQLPQALGAADASQQLKTSTFDTSLNQRANLDSRPQEEKEPLITATDASTGDADVSARIERDRYGRRVTSTSRVRAREDTGASVGSSTVSASASTDITADSDSRMPHIRTLIERIRERHQDR